MEETTPRPRVRTDDPEVPTHAVEIITARVEELVEEASLLHEAVLENSKQIVTNAQNIRTSRRRFYTTMALLIPLLFLMVGLTVVNLKSNQAAEDTLDQLNDCLVLSEDSKSCFAQQQQRTNDILGKPQGPINTVVVLSTACAWYLDSIKRPESLAATEEALTSCVEKELTARTKKKNERGSR